MNTTIGSLANFDLSPLKEGVSETLKKATKAATGMVDKALDLGVEAGTKTEGALKVGVEKAVDTIKKILPFGEQVFY